MNLFTAYTGSWEHAHILPPPPTPTLESHDFEHNYHHHLHEAFPQLPHGSTCHKLWFSVCFSFSLLDDEVPGFVESGFTFPVCPDVLQGSSNTAKPSTASLI